MPQLVANPVPEGPRTFSEVTSGAMSVTQGAMARQTVKQSMDQQASAQRHLEALQSPNWRASLDKLFVLPASPASAGSEKRRTQSESSKEPLGAIPRRLGQ